MGEVGKYSKCIQWLGIVRGKAGGSSNWVQWVPVSLMR